jgi:hypothetical protein
MRSYGSITDDARVEGDLGEKERGSRDFFNRLAFRL